MPDGVCRSLHAAKLFQGSHIINIERLVLKGDEELPFLDDGGPGTLPVAQIELPRHIQGFRVKDLDVFIFLDDDCAFWGFLTWRVVCDKINIGASLQVMLMSDRKFELRDLFPQVRLCAG